MTRCPRFNQRDDQPCLHHLHVISLVPLPGNGDDAAVPTCDSRSRTLLSSVVMLWKPHNPR